MARDRSIQLAVEAGQSRPTLRLYQWARPTVTLGRFQCVDDVDLTACSAAGVDVVRRFTGGRGVLHDDELTYSVVAGTRDGMPRGVAASYRHLSAVLAQAYRNLGIDASITHRDHGPASKGACYLATTRADLACGSLKLAGSAQVWHGSTVLQHGSFTISRDASLESRIFRLSAEETAALECGTATFESLTGERPGIVAIADAVVAAFQEVLEVEFVTEPLSEGEAASAMELEVEVHVEGEGLKHRN